jgi:DNA-binding cell septation regulator SpoVG
MTNAGFTIKEFKPYQKNTLRGFVSIELPSGLILHGLTYHQKEDSRWIGMPAKQYEKDGATTWAPQVEFVSKESRDKFQTAVLAAIDRYQENVL